MSEQKSVLFVCLGNICRSPIAAAVFKHVAKEKGQSVKWKCDSAAIGPWHVGGTMDPRAAKVLSQHGVDNTHTVRQISKKDFLNFDYIFGMDNENIRALKDKKPSNANPVIELLGSHDPQGKLIIRDPYYDDGAEGFEECYQIAYRACKAFLEKF